MNKRLRSKLARLQIGRLRDVLDYDPKTGVLSWKTRISARCKMDEPAGSVDLHGYRRIALDGVLYPAHHLAWFLFYGKPAKDEIDFENLNKDDLRIRNLRQASRAENARNIGVYSSNTTGYKGVARFNTPRKLKYRAQITFNNKRIHLGLFDTAEAAYEAYCKYAKKMHRKFARLA
jgi:hypothetical protein